MEPRSIVGARYYENGEYVKENEKIATLMDTSSVYAVLHVQKQDAVGQRDRKSVV